jgi:hypothetical protein
MRNVSSLRGLHFCIVYCGDCTHSYWLPSFYLVSTLGMVEFFIFLLHNYYEDLDVAKEQVFAKVHFTLFYTAVFNAIQSVVLAFLTNRISHRMWVQTETLELNHYVEIREEFERVSAQLEQLKYRGANKPGSVSCTSGENTEVEQEQQHHQKTSRRAWLAGGGDTEFVFEFNVKGVRNLFGRLLDHIKYPRIKSKHDQLLVQIRFHELRVHFLEAYKLPLKLRISDYLIRSEQQVLIKLVHVSSIAWLLLTAAMNVLYFCLGLVAYQTEDGELVGTTMIWIFFWCLVMFLLLAVLVYNKMKSIFRTIMHKQTLWSIQDDEEIKAKLAQEQMSLFWGGDPKLVIAAIQFMQFGFAIALSVLIIFWEAINDGTVGMEFYCIAIFFGYTLFVTIVAEVIPRYTLCTSLGQLVNQKRLNETVALFHLDEARRQRLEQIELEGYEALDVLDEGMSNRTAPPPQVSTPVIEGVRHLKKTATEGIKNVISTVAKKKPTSPTKRVLEKEYVDSATLMAELVKLDTGSLRTNLPVSEREELSKREAERAKRKGRRKAVSDGVAALTAMGGSWSSATLTMPGSGDSRPKQTLDDFAIPVQKSSGLEMNSNELLAPKDAKAERLERRHRRKKSFSDGVAAMAWTHSKRFDESDLIPSSVPEEEEVVIEFAKDTAPNKAGLSVFNATEPHSNVGALVETGSFADSGERSQADLLRMIKSAGSEDGSENGSVDGHSDVDDVPEVDPCFIQKPDVIYTPGPTLREKFRAYYLSKRFVLVSNVFGTLVAFFLVGQRIERFLHSEGIISDEFITFGFDNEITFWTLTTWLVLFLNTSGMVFYSVRPFKGFESNHERSAVLAAGMDAVLTSICLTFLFVAETQRCCNPDDDSPTSSSGYGRSLAGEEAIYAGNLCGCPTFGSRKYGGLGTIEPDVAILGLRIFRHALARRIVRFMDRRRNRSTANPMGDSVRHNLGIDIDPFDVFGGHGATVDMEKEVGTISALWEVAIGQFPDIVAKHGEFSGELLQAMLGLVGIEKSSETVGGAKDRQIELDGEGRKDVALLDAGASTSRPFVGKAQYSGLSLEAQEIIMAGRVGRKVMSVRRLPAPTETNADPGSFLTSTGGMDNLYFQLDTSTPVPADTDSVFNAPNARLVRSMRRCDRKLLPILDKWVVVDVVMTRFEMVYFDVNDVDEVTQEALENTRQALIATKGGKGLRLCDVAVGRRVVGLLQFSDISSAHVERDTQGSDGEHDDSSDSATQTEYWNRIKADGTHGVLSSHWNNLSQDRLKIETLHGHTLYLRFYSDLEDAEGHPLQVVSDSEEKDIIIKNNAFQWTQTIVRYCGPEQLHQPLPHFGDDNDGELRDYLIALHEGDSKHGQRLSQLGLLARTGFVRRASTHGNIDDILTDTNDLEVSSSNSQGEP